MDNESSQELNRALLDREGSEYNHVEEGQYASEHEPADRSTTGSEPHAPPWLSERMGPLQDSPATLQSLMGSSLGQRQPPLLDRRLTSKHSRSLKRTAAPATRARRQPWIVLDETGQRSFLHTDKRAIIHTTGLNIPIRDMRLLDPSLQGSSDSTILVRDNAIIASMEHVRFIVTADRAIIPREGTDNNPLVARFVDVLEDAILDWARQKNDFEAQQEAEASLLAATGGLPSPSLGGIGAGGGGGVFGGIGGGGFPQRSMHPMYVDRAAAAATATGGSHPGSTALSDIDDTSSCTFTVYFVSLIDSHTSPLLLFLSFYAILHYIMQCTMKCKSLFPLSWSF